MYYLKIGLFILSFVVPIFLFIYSITLVFKFSKKKLNRSEVINRIFWASFWTPLLIFFTYFISEFSGHFRNWFFYWSVSVIVSFLFAISSVAPYWKWRE